MTNQITKKNITDNLKVIRDKISDYFIKISSFVYKKVKRINLKRKPRVYMLRGYTTTSRVDKKYNSEQNQRLLRNILVGAIFALLLSLIIILFNPFKDIKEIFRILGI